MIDWVKWGDPIADGFTEHQSHCAACKREDAREKSQLAEAERRLESVKGCVENLVASAKRAPSHIVPFISVGVEEYGALCDAALKSQGGKSE